MQIVKVNDGKEHSVKLEVMHDIFRYISVFSVYLFINFIQILRKLQIENR